MRLLILSLVVLFAAAQQAGGDDAAPDQWPKTVQAFGIALADNDAGGLVAVLSDDVNITTCDMKNGDAVRLLARTKKGTLIASSSYVFAPETMANDIAEAFKNAEVPEELKKKMAMHDEPHARRANRTAATWIGEALAPSRAIKSACSSSGATNQPTAMPSWYLSWSKATRRANSPR